MLRFNQTNCGDIVLFSTTLDTEFLLFMKAAWVF